jgi:dTDP-4-amino-4,6-dideoxygalactose transaminase
MTDLEAALGLCQLSRLPDFNRRRRELARRYDDALGDHPAFRIPATRDEVEPVYQLYPIRLCPGRWSVDRAAFIEELKAENIGTSVHFIPIHYHPYFRERMNHPRGSFPVAETAFDELVSLPIYPAMSDDDVEDAITAVRKVAAHFSR